MKFFTNYTLENEVKDFKQQLSSFSLFQEKGQIVLMDICALRVMILLQFCCLVSHCV
jgi:hypothetical protein